MPELPRFSIATARTALNNDGTAGTILLFGRMLLTQREGGLSERFAALPGYLGWRICGIRIGLRCLLFALEKQMLLLGLLLGTSHLV